ncbi:hypothetical protein JVU11DRAFT_5280 [Chiua virens]|nr:hypothetical protein JVU11DRAFT_5280 [Chiua virens]
MGFCRRCGDIVTGTRCKCGGAAVAPVLQWSTSKCQPVDKWSQTYISREKSPMPSSIEIDNNTSASQDNVALTGSRPDPNQYLPSASASRSSRPSSSCFSPSVSSRIASHISSSARSPSPLKQPFDLDEVNPPSSPTTLAAEAGILPAPNAPELAKAYGSVLQPKESLATHSCAICLAEFQPDATIFADPFVSELSDRFLCRPCFIVNGGSRGDCPVCHRPVLILKSEGDFVETSGRVWHKKCFRCEGCHKNIGDTPMVDLLGQPSCTDCFDSCLKRNSTPRKSHPLPASEKYEDRTPITFLKDSKSREGSPAIDELEQRLSIMKSREGSPVLEELTQRLNAVLSRTPRDRSPSMSSSTSYRYKDDPESSPLAHRILERKKLATLVASRGMDSLDTLADADTLSDTRTTPPRQAIHGDSPYQDRSFSSTRPSLDAIEEMKNRFINLATTSSVSLTDSISSPASLSNSTTIASSPLSTPSRIPRMSRISGSPRVSWTPSTPELISDISDTLTQSSGPSSPLAFISQAPSREDVGNLQRTYTT